MTEEQIKNNPSLLLNTEYSQAAPIKKESVNIQSTKPATATVATATTTTTTSEPTVLYLSDLFWWTNEDDLVRILRGQGLDRPACIYFLENKKNGKSRGICLVQFNSKQMGQTAYEILTNTELSPGRKINASFASENSIQIAKAEAFKQSAIKSGGGEAGISGALGAGASKNPSTNASMMASFGFNPFLPMINKRSPKRGYERGDNKSPPSSSYHQYKSRESDHSRDRHHHHSSSRHHDKSTSDDYHRRSHQNYRSDHHDYEREKNLNKREEHSSSSKSHSRYRDEEARSSSSSRHGRERRESKNHRGDEHYHDKDEKKSKNYNHYNSSINDNNDSNNNNSNGSKNINNPEPKIGERLVVQKKRSSSEERKLNSRRKNVKM